MRTAHDERFDLPVWSQDPKHPKVWHARTKQEGEVCLEIGRETKKGEDRIVPYCVVPEPRRHIVLFSPADNFKETGEYIAIIRGNGGAGGGKSFKSNDTLPEAYIHRFRTEIYRDRIRRGRKRDGLVVVASEGDEAILDHTLLQVRRLEEFKTGKFAIFSEKEGTISEKEEAISGNGRTMTEFDLRIRGIPEPKMGSLLKHLVEAGYPNPGG